MRRVLGNKGETTFRRAKETKSTKKYKEDQDGEKYHETER
jgi:hypothetical protein